MAKRKARPAAQKKQEMLVEVLLDRSGSMASTLDQTIEGYNEYLKSLKADKATGYSISLSQFDAPGPMAGPELTVSYRDRPLAEAHDLSRESYQPRGVTPLYDAIGKCVGLVEPKDRPVTFVIITDGYENASQEHTQESIRRLIATKEAEGWKFAFLGADIDSFAVGGAIGVSAGATANYAKGQEGAMYANLARSTMTRSQNIAQHGLMAANSMEMFDDSQREAMGGRKPFVSGMSVLTPEEAAEKLKVSRRTIYNQVRSGDIPAKKVGRQWRISSQDI